MKFKYSLKLRDDGISLGLAEKWKLLRRLHHRNVFFFPLFATDRLKSRRRGASKDNLGLRWSEVCFTGMMLSKCARFLLWFSGKKEAICRSKRKLKWLQLRGKSIQRKSHSESSQHLYPHWAIWPRLWAIFGYPRRKIKIAGETWWYFRSWHEVLILRMAVETSPVIKYR